MAPRLNGPAAAGVTVLLMVTACGGGEDQTARAAPSAAAPSSAAPTGVVDRATFLAAFNRECTALSGQLSGMLLTMGNDGRISIGEHEAYEARAKPLRVEFDAAVAALPVPPEAQPVVATWKDFLAMRTASAAKVDAAAAAGDEAAFDKAVAERQKARTAPPAVAAKEAGLNDNCSFRR